MSDFKINFYSWINEFNQSKYDPWKFLPSIIEVIYAWMIKLLWFWCQEIFKCSFYFSFGMECFLVSRVLKTKGSQWVRDQEKVVDLPKYLYPKSVSLWNVILTTRTWALSWSKIEPITFCLTEHAFHPVAGSKAIIDNSTPSP